MAPSTTTLFGLPGWQKSSRAWIKWPPYGLKKDGTPSSLDGLFHGKSIYKYGWWLGVPPWLWKPLYDGCQKNRWFFVTTHVWIIQFWWLRQNDRTLIWRFSFCHGVPSNHPSHGWPWPRIETYGDLGIPNFRTPPYVWKLELEVEVGDLEPWKMWKCQICSDGRATPTKRRGPLSQNGRRFLPDYKQKSPTRWWCN